MLTTRPIWTSKPEVRSYFFKEYRISIPRWMIFRRQNTIGRVREEQPSIQRLYLKTER